MTILQISALELLRILKKPILFADDRISQQLSRGRVNDGELCFVTGKKSHAIRMIRAMVATANVEDVLFMEYRVDSYPAGQGTKVSSLHQLICELRKISLVKHRLVFLATGSASLDDFNIPELDALVRETLKCGTAMVTNWSSLTHLATQCITASEC